MEAGNQEATVCEYIHFMFSESAEHQTGIIEMVESNSAFNKEEHLFVLKSPKVYEANKSNENVILDKQILLNSHICQYAAKARIIIVHSLVFSTLQLYQLPTKVLKKMVWVVWGHDLYNIEGGKTFKERVKFRLKSVRWWLRCQRIKHLCGIGIGFRYDVLRIKESLGNKVPIYNTPYFSEKNLATIRGYSKNETIKTTTAHPTKIMIGHSAFPFLNHLENLGRLQMYRDQNICVSLVLSYGSREYANQVAEKAIAIFGKEKVELIFDSMPYAEYIKYIDSVDIAILDYKHQSALGNFYLLAYLGKKLYVHQDGLLKEAACLEGFETYDTSSIGIVSFDEFANPCDDISKRNMKRFAAYFFDEQTAVNNWKISLRNINKRMKNGS